MAHRGMEENGLPWVQKSSAERRSRPTKEEYAKELKVQMAEKNARDAADGRGLKNRHGPSKPSPVGGHMILYALLVTPRFGCMP